MTTFPIFSGILQISGSLHLLPSMSATWIFGILASCGGYILDNAKKHVDATRPVIRKYLLLLWDPGLLWCASWPSICGPHHNWPERLKPLSSNLGPRWVHNRIRLQGLRCFLSHSFLSNLNQIYPDKCLMQRTEII